MKIEVTQVRRSAGRALTPGLCLIGLLATAPAFGQDEGLSVQRFTPAAGGSHNYVQLEGASVVGSLQPTFGLLVNYAHRPLVLRNSSEELDLLKYDAAVDVIAGLGLGSRFQLGFALPYTFAQAGGELSGYQFPSVAGHAMGDLRIVPKLQLMGGARDGLAISLPIFVPTGDAANLHGEAGLVIEPRLIAERAFSEKLRAGLNVSYLTGFENGLSRPTQSYAGMTPSSELRYGLGAAFDVSSQLTVLGELYGAAGFGVEGGKALALEGDVAARYTLMGGHSIIVGGGPGATVGYGTPLFRVFAGYAFTPAVKAKVPDSDGDGLRDDKDECPDQPEDFDRFQDDDGCPDKDNDGDGLLDTADKCPDKAEDKDSFQDEDGCPDPDNDEDGVLDADDKCPTEKEDRDEFEDNDGCIDPDNDGDGLLDQDDKCPNAPEDKDGLGDEDGCPEADYDKDGVADEVDKCPRRPETINGNQDEDGCPDEGKASVALTSTKIEILEKVYFATNSAEILPKSHKVLKQVISVLKANPQITKLSIEGHTDFRGSDEFNKNLSQARVESVMKFLVDGGIDASRLSATGYGESRPIAPNTTEEGMAKNRRVEFVIMELDGKPVPRAETPVIEVKQ